MVSHISYEHMAIHQWKSGMPEHDIMKSFSSHGEENAEFPYIYIQHPCGPFPHVDAPQVSLP